MKKKTWFGKAIVNVFHFFENPSKGLQEVETIVEADIVPFLADVPPLGTLAAILSLFLPKKTVTVATNIVADTEKYFTDAIKALATIISAFVPGASQASIDSAVTQAVNDFNLLPAQTALIVGSVTGETGAIFTTLTSGKNISFSTALDLILKILNLYFQVTGKTPPADIVPLLPAATLYAPIASPAPPVAGK